MKNSALCGHIFVVAAGVVVVVPSGFTTVVVDPLCKELSSTGRSSKVPLILNGHSSHAGKLEYSHIIP